MFHISNNVNSSLHSYSRIVFTTNETFADYLSDTDLIWTDRALVSCSPFNSILKWSNVSVNSNTQASLLSKREKKKKELEIAEKLYTHLHSNVCNVHTQAHAARPRHNRILFQSNQMRGIWKGLPTTDNQQRMLAPAQFYLECVLLL